MGGKESLCEKMWYLTKVQQAPTSPEIWTPEQCLYSNMALPYAFVIFCWIAQFEKELSVFQRQNHNEPDHEKIPFVHCCMFVNSRGSLWICSSVATSGNGIVLGGPCGCQN